MRVGHALERYLVGWPDAVIHDQQVEAAEGLHRLTDRPFCRDGIPQVTSDGDRPVPPCAALDRPDGFFGVFPAAAVADRDPASGARQHHRRRPPDAAAAPRHERALTGEIDHRPAPNAECGMWNAELSCEIARLNDLPLKFHIPHSEFRIVTLSAVLPQSRK